MLTPFGARLIAAYRTVETQTRDHAAREFKAMMEQLAKEEEGDGGQGIGDRGQGKSPTDAL